MKTACITAVCFVFAAGAIVGRVAQHSYDQPAMKSAADLRKLRMVDGCNLSRTDGFLNYVCAAKPKTGMMR